MKIIYFVYIFRAHNITQLVDYCFARFDVVTQGFYVSHEVARSVKLGHPYHVYCEVTEDNYNFAIEVFE